MKLIIALLILLSSISTVLLIQGVGTITGAKNIVKSSSAQAISLTYAPAADIIQGDIIAFSKTSVYSGTISFTVGTTPTSPLTKDLTFTDAGLYYIFIKPTDDPITQTVRQAVAEAALSKTTITKTEATDVKVDTAATVKFTVAKNMLYDGDKITFSISSGDTPSAEAADTKTITLAGVDFEKTEISQSVTFTKKGTYNIWIDRGSATKQTDQTVEVNGSFVAVSLALFFGLFLF